MSSLGCGDRITPADAGELNNANEISQSVRRFCAKFQDDDERNSKICIRPHSCMSTMALWSTV